MSFSALALLRSSRREDGESRAGDAEAPARSQEEIEYDDSSPLLITYLKPGKA